MKERISAVIIKNKKILLVTGYAETVYWTPGGKRDDNKKRTETLKRELEEEISVKIKKIIPYFSYNGINEITKEKQKVYCYIVEISEKIIPKKEITKAKWFSKSDFEKGKVKLFPEMQKNLIPKLIKDRLL